MESIKIEKILEKYFEGTTTLQEETILKDYFTKETIAPHLQEYKALFMYFNTAKEESYTKTIQLTTKKSQRKNRFWLSIAASIVVLISVFISKEQYELYQQKQEAEHLYAQVSKGLLLLSTNLQKGEQAVASLYAYEEAVHRVTK